MSVNIFRVRTFLHSYCCYVTKAIYIGVKKRTVAEFEWGFATIEHKLYFKSSAIIMYE